MNKIILSGNVGQEPELKTSENGTINARFSLAVSERRTNKTSGEKETSTTWFNLVAFGKTAETISMYVQKGSKLLIEGRVSISEYFTAGGEKKKSFEVLVQNFEFIGTKSVSGPETAVENWKEKNSVPGMEKTLDEAIVEGLNEAIDDDIPF